MISHPSVREVSQCGFAFPAGSRWWASSPALPGHRCTFFGKMSVQSLCPFFMGLLVFLLLLCRSSLYIVAPRTSLYAWFTNIFSRSGGCLSTYLMTSFEAQTFLILMNSIFGGWLLVVVLSFKKPLPNPRSQKIYTCFLLRVLWFEHFEWGLWSILNGLLSAGEERPTFILFLCRYPAVWAQFVEWIHF